MGRILRGFSSWSQLVTLAFQSQVCFSMSKARPDGQLICFKPDRVHLTTSLQPPSMVSLKYSSPGLPSHSCSTEGSSPSLAPPPSSFCLLTLSGSPLANVKIKPTQNKIENLYIVAIATDYFFVNKFTFIN
uniref:Uncharacterized protein n=1 Tax=Cacopsylla melanoneura TaxID=428564 RepID=A0A8D8RL64_9HEMI